MGRLEHILQYQEHQGFYENMKDHLQIEPEFRDLISYRIIATSMEEVKSLFEYYREGWSLLGKDTSNYSEVYDEFFNVEDSPPLRSTEEILKEIDMIVENAKDPNLIIDYRRQNTNAFDVNEEDPKAKPRRCIKCNMLFNTVSNDTCDSCKKEEDDFKWFDPFSFRGILYLGILGAVLYVLYNNVSISYTSFLVLGGLVLFAFLYFDDNYKKK